MRLRGFGGFDVEKGSPSEKEPDVRFRVSAEMRFS
jgi:hypothetical protein